MNERLRNLFRDMRSDPKHVKQTGEVTFEIVQYEPDTLGLGFYEFVLCLEDDGTWHVIDRLGI